MTEKTYRAYSLLTEKSFDSNNSISVIRGIATTPTPDRISDIVVPTGVVFRTKDIKLHLNHDTRMPVGQVSFGKPTNKGIPFEATLPEIEEPGIVQDRVNEAKHSVKYNLISAVSIGFRPLEDGIELMPNGGLKFTSWEMIELSLTSVPANPDAIIQAAKSIQGGSLPREIIDSLRKAERNSGVIKLIQAKTGTGAIKLVR
jgi:HK97 family phage prohead protease